MAQFTLGTMYHLGEGIPRDFAQALKWIQLGAEQGYAHAQYNLGHMYFTGEGVKHAPAVGFKWFHRAAEQGLSDAQYNLGSMYWQGMGVQQDNHEAVKWLQRAADQSPTCTEALDMMQDDNAIPTPPPGTTITTILLTSAKASKYNSRTGKVVAQPFTKPGRAAVLLDGEVSPISFKLKNLQIV